MKKIKNKALKAEIDKKDEEIDALEAILAETICDHEKYVEKLNKKLSKTLSKSTKYRRRG